MHQSLNPRSDLGSSQDAKYLHPFNSAALKNLADDNPGQASEYVIELLKFSEKLQTIQNFWLPTPNNSGDPQPIRLFKAAYYEELESIQKLKKPRGKEIFSRKFQMGGLPMK